MGSTNNDISETISTVMKMVGGGGDGGEGFYDRSFDTSLTSLLNDDNMMMQYHNLDNPGQSAQAQDPKEQDPNRIELLQLLKSWNQEELIDVLWDQKVYVSILRIIKRHHIDKLFKNHDLGTQILFEHNLETWRNLIGMPLCDSSSGPLQPYSSSATSTASVDMEPTSPASGGSSEGSFKFVTLSMILNNSQKSSSLIEFYKKHSRFKEEQRTLLINIVAQYYDDNNLHMSLKCSHKLEEEILERFPNEKLEYYRTSCRGRIYNKISNLKATFKSIVNPDCPKKKKRRGDEDNFQKRVFVPETDAESCIRSLKYDNLSSEEFDNVWKACAQFRLNQIQQSGSTAEVMEKWIYYKTPSGYRLIDMDYTALFDSGTFLLDKWEGTYQYILDFLTSSHNVKDKNVNRILQIIKDGNISEKSRDAALFWSMHAYLLPTNVLVKKDTSGKKSTVKFTIKDSQESFVYLADNVQQAEDHIKHMKTLKQSIQPFIIVIGTEIIAINEIYIYFDDIKYHITNFLRAVDICFKIFFVFNLNFPGQCSTFWSFIEHYFFEIEEPKKSYARVHLLSAELKHRIITQNE